MGEEPAGNVNATVAAASHAQMLKALHRKETKVSRSPGRKPHLADVWRVCSQMGKLPQKDLPTIRRYIVIKFI